MRPSTGPLVRTHPCRCGDVHPAVVMIAGLPLLVCPQVDGDAVCVVIQKNGIPYLVTGEAARE